MASFSDGILIKKKFGQHFLRDESVARHMIDHVQITPTSSVFEIGVGDGVLTREILTTKAARLWAFEIDQEWADYVSKTVKDPRLTVFLQDILQLDFSRLEEHKPWILLANLPYQITFPIMHLLQQNRHLLQEGVVMIQEEVAQKIVKEGGRGYGYSSLFFQHFFELKLLNKVPPGAFLPPPKVYSRLLYFKTKKNVPVIRDEEHFWKFIKILFHQPRRTIKNNLMQSNFDISSLSHETLALRAQQLTMADFLAIWEKMRVIQQ